jgi:SAM-dependent methyltransferase
VRTYCTLFDVNYLTRALVLHHSLARVSGPLRLFAFCMDDAASDALARLGLPDVEIVTLPVLEAHDPALLSTKSDRTQVEYCWTATPAVCRYVLETQPEVDEVTYLDADIQFFSDPEPLFDELGDDAVLIVPHRYAPEHRHKESSSGTYNVEWLTFKRDDDGLAALRWWHERCIEWCYFRWEDGKLGDQKYLDEFPRLFSRVHSLEHPGGGLAPWNVTAHELSERDGHVFVDGRPLVFYHFHSLRLYGRGPTTRGAVMARRARTFDDANGAWATNYPVSAAELRLVWEPYLRALMSAGRELEAVSPSAQPEPPAFPAGEIARLAFGFARRRLGLATSALAGRLPGARERYRQSWRDDEVAAQMAKLTEEQLRGPATVPPYEAFRRLLPTLLEQPELRSPASFLDLGCGAGGYADLLERYAPGRFTYTGADYSEEVLAVARARAPGRRYERRDLYEPGAVDGFDVVFVSALVDVLPDPERALDILLASDAPYVVLHRQRIGNGGNRVDVVPGYGRQRTYRSTITQEFLERTARRHSRSIVATADVQDDVRSFLLARDAC